MSELLGNSPEPKEEPIEIPNGKVETGIKGVYADGHVEAAGGMKHPVFKVDKDDFYNNLTADRKKMRFSNPDVKSYMQNTKYKQPFYIDFQDGKKTLRRRVK
jgi:hypothetical protein